MLSSQSTSYHLKAYLVYLRLDYFFLAYRELVQNKPIHCKW